MKFRIFPAAQLSAEHLAAWSRLQRSDATLASPYFRPEFTQAVAAVRGDVEVAVWEQAGKPVGFLPFQRNGRRVGMPVGSPMNDFQGAIAQSDVAWSPQEVVRSAGLRAWRFDHLLTSQTAFAPFQYVFAESPYLDLSQGFEHYFSSRSYHFRKQFRKLDRTASRYGDVRLETNPADRDALRSLVEWKIDQCRRTHVPCTFAEDWSLKLIEHILAHPTEEFSGLLSSLYVGDRIAAVLFAIRSGNVLHEWISAFNRDLGELRPGLILQKHLAQAACSLGITRIDLGTGDEFYKSRLATGSDQLAEGTVHARSLHAPIHRAWIRTKDRLRSTRLRGPVTRARRWLLSTRVWLGFTH
jgi:CelD/BcsL family acetyltransferase involved in cellulose biosynthesis